MGLNSSEIVTTVTNATATGATVLDDNVDRFNQAIILLNVTAVTGTSPTMDLIVEHSLDNTTWVTAATFTQATGVTTEIKTIATPFGSRMRLSYTIGGVADPDFTFTVTTLLKG
jgi:hypothetical protein